VKIGRPGIPGIKPGIPDPGFIPVVSKIPGNGTGKSGNRETGFCPEPGPVSSLIYKIILKNFMNF
jgi:hypothetical protein